MQGLHGLLGKKTLSFQARGDGRRYMLMVISGRHDATAFRSCIDFEAGPEWQEVRLELAKSGGVDLKRVRAHRHRHDGPGRPVPLRRSTTCAWNERRDGAHGRPRMRLKQLLQNIREPPAGLDGRAT